MRMHAETLDRYRDAIMQVVHGNNQALLLEDRMSDEQKAGTSLLMAAASVSFAAALVAKTKPRLRNAPMDAQIEDLLNLLRDTLIQIKPNLKAVQPEDTPS
ncbi:hypothetical protein [Ruegeria sp. EL01]|uniref:hypothetical protein n=1 Tax=Ruegeria sp. EL01 TaxID=2107578 RepID=UPI000EA823D1|nr:hypothetical protein [Ruegeria sp. EL01]